MRWLAASLACLAAGCVGTAPVREEARAPVHPRLEGRQPAPPAPTGFAIRSPGFEETAGGQANCVAHWSCRVHVDPHSFRIALDEATFAEGRRSLRIEKVGPEPWASVVQSLPAKPVIGERLRYSMAVRLEGVAGRGAGVSLMTVGPNGVIEHKETTATGTSGWRRLSVEIEVPPGAERVEVGAILEAEGRLWIDDARIERLGASSRR